MQLDLLLFASLYIFPLHLHLQSMHLDSIIIFQSYGPWCVSIFGFQKIGKVLQWVVGYKLIVQCGLPWLVYSKHALYDCISLIYSLLYTRHAYEMYFDICPEYLPYGSVLSSRHKPDIWHEGVPLECIVLALGELLKDVTSQNKRWYHHWQICITRIKFVNILQQLCGVIQFD